MLIPNFNKFINSSGSVLFAITTLMMGKTKPEREKRPLPPMSGVENIGFVIDRIPTHDFNNTAGIYESQHL